MKQTGFTLVEILLTLVVITVGIVAVHQGFIRCVTAVERSEKTLYESFVNERAAVDALLGIKTSETR